MTSFGDSLAFDSAGEIAAPRFGFSAWSTGEKDDSLVNGAIFGGVIGSAAGIYVFRDWSEFAGNDPGTKETLTGLVIGGALGASVGMLIDALF